MLSLFPAPPHQEQQRGCTEGHTLLNALQRSREALLAWGAPSLEERQLEVLQADWSAHQARLGETRAQLNSTLAKLRQIEQKFHRLDTWLKGMESKGQLRSSRRSDRATKEAQLQMLEVRAQPVSQALQIPLYCRLPINLLIVQLTFFF